MGCGWNVDMIAGRDRLDSTTEVKKYQIMLKIVEDEDHSPRRYLSEIPKKYFFDYLSQM